ncbi:MAG TPA: DUF2167 domain-containing protein [Burkholderiaceae bacterium]
MTNPIWRAGACAMAVALTLGAPRLAAAAESEQDIGAELKKLPWQEGPAKADVGSRSKIQIPDGARLLPESSGSKFLELTGNLPEQGDTVLVRNGWWATLSFEDSGYVKDDEKLDPDALLAALNKGEEQSNEERKKRGMATLTNDGWIVPPHYDPKTKFLEYGLRLHSSDSPRPVVNYTMRLLSRHGYETVILVTGPDTLDRDVKDLHQVLDGFAFNPGETYGEFRAGDHVAEFGLGALVLGGAAAAAVKAGWFKGLIAALAAGWKLVAAGAVALLAGVKRLFGRATGR